MFPAERAGKAQPQDRAAPGKSAEGKQGRGGGDRSEGGGRQVRGRRQAKQTMRPFHSVVKTFPFNFPEMEYNESSPRWIK